MYVYVTMHQIKDDFVLGLVLGSSNQNLVSDK